MYVLCGKEFSSSARLFEAIIIRMSEVYAGNNSPLLFAKEAINFDSLFHYILH